ncbi:MAG: uridine kinase [SAR324 cluster bacterium]|nr:uridine kinase [SAR324 cluster bacterium]
MKIIGIAGGTKTGKSLFANHLAQFLPSASILSLDNYFLDKPARIPIEQHNFYIPTAFDFKSFHIALEDLRKELPVQMPNYDQTKGKRLSTVKVVPKKYLIIEGLYSLMHASIRSLMSYSFYLESPPDVVLSRFIRGNLQKWNYPLEYSIQQYFTFVRPAFYNYVVPTRQHAHLVVTNDYNSGLDLFLQDFLNKYQL